MEAAFALLFERELKPEYLDKLQRQFEDHVASGTHLTPAARTIQQSMDTGRAVVSSSDWLAAGALAERTVLEGNRRLGDPVLQAYIRQTGVDWHSEMQYKEARGQWREYAVTNLLRAPEVHQAFREGGIEVRDSSTRPEWKLYTALVGSDAECALVALVARSRLLGAMHIRHIQEAQGAGIQFFGFMREAYDCEDCCVLIRSRRPTPQGILIQLVCLCRSTHGCASAALPVTGPTSVRPEVCRAVSGI
jgi:hypothetical protein